MSEELLVVLLGLILVLLYALKTRERFVLKYGNPFKGQDLISFDREAKGTRLFATTPDTCPADRPILDGGLCYPECDDGYHGIGPVCWADTTDIGPGILADFRTCSGSVEEGGMGIETPQNKRAYTDIGLFCFWPGKWDAECNSEKRDLFGNCYAWDVEWKIELPDLVPKGLRCPGRTFQLTSLFDLLGEGLGKISDATGVDLGGSKLKTNIDDFKDLVDGLCYRQCPSEKPNHIGGAPYLCTKGERGISYGRGAGTVPPLFAFGP